MSVPVPVDRRGMLALLGALPAGTAFARLGAAEDMEVFHDIVRAIGGVTPLPPELLAGCTKEFSRNFGEEAISGLAALARRRRTLAAMERGATLRIKDQLTWIATFLYTGETKEGVTYYPWCLGWHALYFATAPGQCGGQFGHWAGPEL